jgi:homoserine O-acetyltransferase/O-succinyltransferase
MNMHPDYLLPAEIPDLQYFRYADPFTLKSGYTFPNGITIGYHTYGQLNKERNNVIWVCHALTANSRVDDWWSGLFGRGRILDPTRYFIVCANVLGSCYGSTGARSLDPESGKPYGMNWPLVTVRDWVQAHDRLRMHLGIDEIRLCIGGSCGGHQVLEMAYLLPDKIKHLGLLVTSARETAWVIAGHEAQRLAMLADPTLYENENHSGKSGMHAARGIALLGYRTIESYIDSQTDKDEILKDHKASTYIRYQGEKLGKRFYPHCYWHLIHTLDTHHMGRGRESMPVVLQRLKMKSTIVAIDTDHLIPIGQQMYLAQHLPDATLHVIHSPYGHDGFLIETEQINALFT